MTATVTALHGRDATTVQAAIDAFLSSTRCVNPNTRRGYAGVLDRLLAELGPDRRLASLAGDELADLLEQLWGHRAPATWNRNRAAVAGWLSWCARNRLPAPALPASCERRREPANTTRAVSRSTIERALSRRDGALVRTTTPGAN